MNDDDFRVMLEAMEADVLATLTPYLAPIVKERGAQDGAEVGARARAMMAVLAFAFAGARKDEPAMPATWVEQVSATGKRPTANDILVFAFVGEGPYDTTFAIMSLHGAIAGDRGLQILMRGVPKDEHKIALMSALAVGVADAAQQGGGMAVLLIQNGAGAARPIPSPSPHAPSQN